MAKAEPRSITRRSMLAAFALSAVPLLSAGASPSAQALAPPLPAADPVFAAIEAHVRAFRAFNTVLDALAVAETQAWHAPRGARRAANRRLKQAYAAERQFGDLEADAIERLVATVPQTLHGAAAALRYVRERFEHGHTMEEEDYVTLIGSVEHAIFVRLGT